VLLPALDQTLLFLAGVAVLAALLSATRGGQTGASGASSATLHIDSGV
jgi:hypothetical protein